MIHRVAADLLLVVELSEIWYRASKWSVCDMSGCIDWVIIWVAEVAATVGKKMLRVKICVNKNFRVQIFNFSVEF